MQLPIIHTNGTSARDLTEGYIAASSAIETALDVVRKIEFHARDYYVDPNPAAFETARAEFSAQVQALRDASAYFEAIACHCSDFIKT